MTATSERAAVGLRSERGPVLIALMLSTSLVALDSTILATAVPSVVDDLGGFSQFPWLFSLFLLAQAVSVPIYGKLADQVGRKPMMLTGIGIFVAGSIFCGFAWSLPALIVFRAIQGLGAGAIIPMSQTILGDLYSVAERARVTGYLASVWGISSVIGPTIGGVFSDYLTWRWIFFVNIPLGALAAFLLIRDFTEKLTRTKHRVDYAGAVTLAAAFSLIILALLEGGEAWSWTSPISIGAFALGFLLLLVCGLIERRAAEPVLPGWVLSRRILLAANVSSFAIGALLFGLTTYIPTFAQGVLGTGALPAGFALAALTLGWPIAASLSGRVYLRLGFRNTALIGSVFALAGSVLVYVVVRADAHLWEIGASCFVVGVGMGLVNSPVLVAIQSVVGWDRRGLVTSANLFNRSVGSAVGVAVFGAIANATLSGRSVNQLTPADAGPLLQAVHHVFLGVVVVGLLMIAAVAFIPRHPQPLFPDPAEAPPAPTD